MDINQLLSMNDAASYLNLSVRYLYVLVHQKKIKHYKARNRVLFHKADLDVFKNRKKMLIIVNEEDLKVVEPILPQENIGHYDCEKTDEDERSYVILNDE